MYTPSYGVYSGLKNSRTPQIQTKIFILKPLAMACFHAESSGYRRPIKAALVLYREIKPTLWF
jgi:hypothetical protein